MRKFLLRRLRIFYSIFSAYAMFRAARDNCRNPPGHFYSPVVNVKEVLSDEDRIWVSKPVASIDINLSEQLNLLREFETYYRDFDFPEEATAGTRYYMMNSYYSFSDGFILYSFIRYFQPSRIIEIGSGFSSALMLDVCERFNLSTKLSFIEPYPKRLHSLLSESDQNGNEIVTEKLQAVPLSFFAELKKGDVLFIDSTHVCKTGSDVNYIVFEIFPILAPGVIIHIHDIFDSFEYPKKWVQEKRSWNEVYLVRAFLMNNSRFRILFFCNWLQNRYSDAFKNVPICYRDKGSNFWFQKT